jgi:bile acid-coenzyme A ligase
MGWLDADNYLYLADRRTDMIVSGGSNIYPAEVEAALDQHAQIASSVVVGLPDDDFGHRVHAILELRDGVATLDPGNVEAFVATLLARYKLPYSYEVARERLRDDAGKVRRSALRDACLTRIQAGETFARLRG